jgi:uncharacterized protein DUF4349
MSRREPHPMSASARRDLDAIDAALAGVAVAPESRPVAELACTLRELRPTPAHEFTRALDARAARGFKRERRRPAAGGAGAAGLVGALHAMLRTPAVGAALGVVTLLAVALAVALPGSHGPAVTPRPGAVPASGAGASRAAPESVEAARGSAGPDTARAAGTQAPAPAGAEASGSAREVERTSTLDVGIEPGSVESAAQQVFTLVSAYGGYVRQSNVSAGGPGSGASFDVRVPTRNLAAAIAALSRLGHVRSETDTTSDVTDRYGALRRSLGDARAERASLLRQLAAADTPARAVSVRARLRAVEARIAGLDGALRALTSRIDYTPLALSLTPEHAPAASTGDLTPGGAAGDAARVLDVALAVLLIAGAAVLPIALVGLAAWVAVALARRRLREQALDVNP